jgi:hypothetical protein
MDTHSSLFMFLSLMKNNNNNASYDLYSIIGIFLLGILSKFIPNFTIYDIKHFFKTNNKNITIDIPTYQIPVIRSCSSTPQTKNVYSTRFLAITNFLNENHIDKFISMTETMTDNKELNWGYYEDDSSNKPGVSYALIPFDNKSILIHKNPNIYCDFNLQEENESNNDDKKNDNKTTFKINKKMYIISLYIKKEDTLNGKYNMNDLDKFVNDCVLKYELSKKKNNNINYIYHYRCCEKSDNNIELKFDEDVFETTKNLHKNIFFEGKEKVIKLIQPFINDSLNKDESRFEKYDLCGKPRCFNMLLCGKPGCGKTSFIKSIIKETKRTPININLASVKTRTELELIFKQKRFNGRDYSRSKLIYILEDFDAMNCDFLFSRKESEKPPNDKLPSTDEPKSDLAQIVKLFDPICVKNISYNDDSLNLSCFLNILDGLVELHEGMIIMTTNHPEKLDPAVYRPGRVDWHHEFTYASKNTIIDMIKMSFQLSDKEILKHLDSLQIKDEILSPAEVQQICFLNTDVEECIRQIVLACQKKNKY